MTKIERDNGQSVQTAYEYSYTGDGIRHMKKDYLAEKEYRYGCSIDCGGTPLRVYSRDLGSQGEWSTRDELLTLLNATWHNDLCSRPWLFGDEIFELATASTTLYYKDRFGEDVASPIEVARAWWREYDDVFGPGYSHAWIEFDRDCDGNKGWGFYPGGGKKGGIFGGRGTVIPEGSYLGRGDIVQEINDPACEAALCACIRDSSKSPPKYCVIGYNCGSWVVDMIACAEQRTGKRCRPVPRPSPPPPYQYYPELPQGGGGIVPGGCYRDSSGFKLVCN